MPLTAYTDVSPRVGIIAVSQFLKHAEHAIVFNKLGQVERVPKNKGQVIKWRRYVPFDPITVALTEGVTPSSQKLAVVDVSATLGQYGGWSEITDVIQDTHEDPILQGMTQIHGQQASESFETLTYLTLRAGTNVVYNNGTARNQVNTKIALGKLRSAVRTLNKNKCRKKTSILAPSVNYKHRRLKRLTSPSVIPIWSRISVICRALCRYPSTVPVSRSARRNLALWKTSASSLPPLLRRLRTRAVWTVTRCCLPPAPMPTSTR